jgi:uncharacterized protein YjbJ (UPF0337 family)
MNWDEIKGDWKQFTGRIKEQWGKLTEDDLAQINGKKEELIGKIQERYGQTKDEAMRRVDEFVDSLKIKMQK